MYSAESPVTITSRSDVISSWCKVTFINVVQECTTEYGIQLLGSEVVMARGGSGGWWLAGMM